MTHTHKFLNISNIWVLTNILFLTMVHEQDYAEIVLMVTHCLDFFSLTVTGHRDCTQVIKLLIQSPPPIQDASLLCACAQSLTPTPHPLSPSGNGRNQAKFHKFTAWLGLPLKVLLNLIQSCHRHKSVTSIHCGFTSVNVCYRLSITVNESVPITCYDV